jgi:hypothetical protein
MVWFALETWRRAYYAFFGELSPATASISAWAALVTAKEPCVVIGRTGNYMPSQYCRLVKLFPAYWCKPGPP